MTSSVECTVTLVHGTIPHIGPIRLFANQAWIAEHSPFRAEFSKILEAKFVPFSWSGRNSHIARLQAGKDLARVLRGTIQEHPSVPHYVVAHSHGGNVLLYALKEMTDTEQRQITGVVTLGTPFIHSCPQDVVTLRDDLMFFLKYGTIAWIFCVLGLLVCAYFGAASYYGNSYLWFIAFSVFIGFAGILLWSIASKYPIEAWERAANATDELLDAKLTTNLPIFCIVANRDEAALWLRVWGWCSRTFFGPWQIAVLRAAMAPLREMQRILPFGTNEWALWWHILQAFAFLISLTLSGLGLLVVFSILIGTATTFSSSWVYGQTALQYWVTAVSTNEMPNTDRNRQAWVWQTKRLTQLGLNFDRMDKCAIQIQKFAPKSFAFQHSWLHDDNEIVMTVARWIRARVDFKLLHATR